MTPQEFKAWFDGFTEAFEGKVPTKAQWTRIKERVGEIDGKSVTERIYVDRYWPSYVQPFVHPNPRYGWTYLSAGISATGASLQQSMGQNTQQLNNFNSLSAMNNLGRVEASNLGAS